MALFIPWHKSMISFLMRYVASEEAEYLYIIYIFNTKQFNHSCTARFLFLSAGIENIWFVKSVRSEGLCVSRTGKLFSFPLGSQQLNYKLLKVIC